MSDITPIHGEALAKALENQKPEKAVSPTGEPIIPARLVPYIAFAAAALVLVRDQLELPEPWPKYLGTLSSLLMLALGVTPGLRRNGAKVVALLLVPALGVGCVNFRPPPPSRVASLAPEAAPFEFQPPPECKTYDRDRKVWGALGRSAALGSGAAGLTSLVTDNDSGGLRRGFGLASLALGIFAAGASWYADQQAADYVSRCTQ